MVTLIGFAELFNRSFLGVNKIFRGKRLSGLRHHISNRIPHSNCFEPLSGSLDPISVQGS